MRKLDEEMKPTNKLLYQMIPKLVVNRLRKEENTVVPVRWELVVYMHKDTKHLYGTLENNTPRMTKEEKTNEAASRS